MDKYKCKATSYVATLNETVTFHVPKYCHLTKNHNNYYPVPSLAPFDIAIKLKDGDLVKMWKTFEGKVRLIDVVVTDVLLTSDKENSELTKCVVEAGGLYEVSLPDHSTLYLDGNPVCQVFENERNLRPRLQLNVGDQLHILKEQGGMCEVELQLCSPRPFQREDYQTLKVFNPITEGTLQGNYSFTYPEGSRVVINGCLQSLHHKVSYINQSDIVEIVALNSETSLFNLTREVVDEMCQMRFVG